MATRIELSDAQYDFASSRQRFPAYVAGFGAGKTFAGISRAVAAKSAYPSCNVGYYLPTYDLVQRVGYEGFQEFFEHAKVRHKLIKSLREIVVHGAGKIIFRSMDNPASIVGFKHSDAIVDELDTLKPDDARNVWRKVIARNRQKKPDGKRNSVAVTTTPEGFRFTYDTWQKDPKALEKGYEIFRGSTYDNVENLSEDYIPSLLASYPANLIEAYIHGRFVNLTSGCVYPDFSRTLNASRETIQRGVDGKSPEPLHIGLDFNVGKMAAAVNVLRDGDPHAVDEIVDVLDTPTMARVIAERFPGHPIIVYPDASGNARKSQNASESDIVILKASKFTVCVNSANPAIRDRVLAANALIHSDGKRRFRVNEDKCPHLVEALEKQAYDKNGEPDKSTGLDHIIDAQTYFLAYKWPIRRPVMSINLGYAR